MLKIHNTLTRDKQTFTPIDPHLVRMYVCGMTVYDYCHLGHARVLVVFDMVARWLRASGYKVVYVRNITDIDDKIIKRAQENGESIHALTERYIGFMDEDAAALGVMKPDFEPRATQYVPAMQRLISLLETNGYAYVAANQDVCYSVRKFEGYGRLSGKSLEDLRAGERVEVAGGKNDPLDFVLWKHAKAEEPAEAKWESPWGIGRPGWHIECSAMSSELLGTHFDIHGGGQDLQFPHHENEIAQSEGALRPSSSSSRSGACTKHQHPFVNYWMHNGFVRVDDEKMSKSLGNFFTIREVLKQYDAEVLRFFILRAHYRSPLNHSDAHLDDARASLTRLYTALKVATPSAITIDWEEPHAAKFRAAMDDDFNTAEAISVLFELANEANKTESVKSVSLLKALGGLLGLLERDPAVFLQATTTSEQSSGSSVAEIDTHIAARHAAKMAKNYAEADRVRQTLMAAGIVLEDKPGGVTEWRRA